MNKYLLVALDSSLQLGETMRITAKHAAIERIIEMMTREARNNGYAAIDTDLRKQLQSMTLRQIYEAEAAYHRSKITRQEPKP